MISISKHLKKFVKQQLDKRILNAWHAKFSYDEITNNEHVIQCIILIDYQNTGIIQTNTSWPKG